MTLSTEIQTLWLILFDLIVIALFLLAALPFAKAKHAAYAVLKRNFLAYFSNPTGYVFLCLFVLLTSLAAFWPHDFFQSNLATLDQLNLYLPPIMLVFISAITMSIWAEERRQGTDELLLTIPAGDFDIVIGKYLAAVAIFTASLLFSQLTNFAVLNALTLGEMDMGLFITTYFGYWMIGLAMLAVGMVASFLTKNLTVGFILGALFNIPLVASMWADTIIPSSSIAMSISRWSYFTQSEEFCRGVISLGAVVYFLMIVVIGIYLSVVLIGSRHWLGGRDGSSLLGHYIVRVLGLVVIAMSINVLFANYNGLRRDMTVGKIGSLSKDTKQLLRDLSSDGRQIYVEAFISESLPKQYVKTKIDIISMLNELKAFGGKNVNISIYDGLQNSSPEAVRAKEQYGIEPRMVVVRERDSIAQKEIFLGAVFRCGLEKVVVPFVDRGIPVEYEMIRSICTVAEQERQKIGVVKTDADLFGGFQMGMGMPRQVPKQLIIEELEKQYDVVQVDPTNPIVEAYDVLLAVQPSSLTPPQLENLLDAIDQGVPTAIFEDPMPVALSSQPPGTSDPRRPQGGMFGGGQPPEPKGDITRLWKKLGISMKGENQLSGAGKDVYVVWQDYNPYPKTRSFRNFTKQFVFVGPDAPGAEDPLDPDNKISSGLQQLLFLFPGAITHEKNDSDLKFSPLVTTGSYTGYIKTQDLRNPGGDPRMQRWAEVPTNNRYVLAAHIQPGEEEMEDEGQADTEEESEVAEQEAAEDGGSGQEQAGQATADSEEAADQEEGPSRINVVYVSDVDLLSSAFLELRAQPDEEVEFQFDNVTFVLNVLDVLAGDDRFTEIRKRQTRHSTLKKIYSLTAEAREDAEKEIASYEADYGMAEQAAGSEMKKHLAAINEEIDKIRETGKSSDLKAAQIRLAIRQQVEERRRDAEIESLKMERNRKLEDIERQLELKTREVQNRFKFYAAALPPIPPLLVGCLVFIRRRLREREGVSRERLR